MSVEYRRSPQYFSLRKSVVFEDMMIEKRKKLSFVQQKVSSMRVVKMQIDGISISKIEKVDTSPKKRWQRSSF